MEWLRILGDLSPAALLLAAVWVIAVKVISPVLKSHGDTIQRLSSAQEKSAETMKEGIDANSKAVSESVKHNEKIITNHLSAQAKRDSAMIQELRLATSAIDDMNHRRRALDNEERNE